MGILATLSLSAGNAPRAEKNNFVDKVASECLQELKFKRIGKKSL